MPILLKHRLLAFCYKELSKFKKKTPIRTMGKKLDILIVGGGIAGLAAAIALRIKGHNVTILEAAAQVISLPWQSRSYFY